MSSKIGQDRSKQIAIVLSALFPGAGQLYNRETGKAAAFFIGNILLEIYLLPEGYWDIITGVTSGETSLTLNLYLRVLVLLVIRGAAVLDAERSARPRSDQLIKKSNSKSD